MPRPNPPLPRISKIALSLPDATVERHGSHATFRVRKKVFAYFLDNHHGDGIVGLACKVGPGDNTMLIEAQPDRFCMPAYIGSRGWVTLRVDRGEIDWEEVAELLRDSYRRTAPKTLAAKVHSAGRAP